MAVYLLHFERKISHSQHYIGFAEDVEKRIAKHRADSDARIVQVFTERGIGFTVARVWENKTREFERYLKDKYKRASYLCPICNPKR